MSTHSDALTQAQAEYDKLAEDYERVGQAFVDGQAELDVYADKVRDREAQIAARDGDILILKARIAELENPPVVTPPVVTPPVLVPPAPAASAYGPTGKHWPERTPRLTDAVQLRLEAGTPAQLATAITLANSAVNIGKTARIDYTADITGLGGGATSKAVLQDVGVARRAGGRILITPKGGIGSLNIVGSSARFYKVRGVSFVGFNGWAWGQKQVDAKGVLVSGVEDFAWAWSKSRYANITGVDKESNVEFVEVVAPESHLWPADGTAADRWQWKNGGTQIGTTYARVIGCYLAPVRTSTGDKAHLDAWQIFNAGKWDVTALDSVVFAATNQGIITTSETSFVLDHTLVIGGDSTHERYPMEPGAEVALNQGAPWPVNGAPSPAIVKNGSLLIGTPKGWKPTYDATSGQRASLSKAELDARSAYPTDDYLKGVWK